MDYFSYKNGKLFAENVDVDRIAAEVGTPVYIYSKATFKDHLQKIQEAYSDLTPMICYSVKACGNINILQILAQAGSGFDIVSGGELYRVLQAGGEPSKIVYAGVGKTDAEIIEALNADIAYFNIESEAELQNLIRLAKRTGKTTKQLCGSTRMLTRKRIGIPLPARRKPNSASVSSERKRFLLIMAGTGR